MDGPAPALRAGTSGGRHRRPAERHRALAVLGTAILVLLVALVVGALPVQLTRIGSDSMAPTFTGGDLVLLNRWHGAPARFDVVVVERAADDGEALVKRVVGLGGDTLSIEDGVLVVDGTPVCEPWSDPSRLDGVWFGPITVPDGSLYLLGDEREGSVDSRAFGPVPEDDVVGLVPARVWPAPGAVPTAVC